MKQCSKCSTPYPATPEFFYRDRSKHDGLHTVCKTCSDLHKEGYVASHKDLVAQRHKRAYERNKEQRAEKAKLYREKNKEQIAKDKKQYQQGEKHKAYQKRYQQGHKAEISAQSRQYYQSRRKETCERQRQRRKSNPELFATIDKAHKAKRRAQKLAAGGSHTAQDIQAQYQRQKGACYWCHKKLTEYHIDHVIPLARGGSNGPDNLVVACPRCNTSRRAKLPHEWPEGGRLL